MASAFVSKSRKVRFDLTLRIIDLNNVPLVSGTSFIKWHLPSSKAAEDRGRTSKCLIKDHRVVYDYEKPLPVRLTVAKDGMLQECSIHFEVLQEYSAGGRGERIALGHIKLNLAEYVESSEAPSPTRENGDDGQGVVRRYLMQDSKINSTLKVGIHMKHTEGTREYYAPSLRTAPVFGGIAGIITSSEPASTTHGVASHSNGAEGGHDGLDTVPSLSSTNKETGEMQDMYRRTLAAYWAAQPGELKADECIEDIFAGGDGWGKTGQPQGASRDQSQPGSGTSTPNPDGDLQSMKADGPGRGMMRMGARERHAKYGAKVKMPRKGAGELDEFDIREDLRSWRVRDRGLV